MTRNNNLSPLPWYHSIQEQDHRKPYAFGDVYPLFTPIGYLPPFQIIRGHRATLDVSFHLYNLKGEEVADLSSAIWQTGLRVAQFASLGYDVIVYPARIPMTYDAKEGQYYAIFSDGVDAWVSEVFTVVNMAGASYLKIEWWDSENMVYDGGQIVYENPAYRNRLYLKTQIGKPDYIFEEEGETRDGYFFPEKQISEKTYKFTITAPEYLCDVMRTIRMSDFVKITDNYSREYTCDMFLITPKWQTQGNIASVEVEFQTDTVIKKIGRGYIPETGADFNNDFNDDYDIIL